MHSAVIACDDTTVNFFLLTGHRFLHTIPPSPHLRLPFYSALPPFLSPPRAPRMLLYLPATALGGLLLCFVIAREQGNTSDEPGRRLTAEVVSMESPQSMLLTSEQNNIMRLPNYSSFMRQQVGCLAAHIITRWMAELLTRPGFSPSPVSLSCHNPRCPPLSFRCSMKPCLVRISDSPSAVSNGASCVSPAIRAG